MFTLAVSALTALLFGLAPAFEATRVGVVSTLKNEGWAAPAGPARSRLRRVLVAGEIALTLTLLTGTGLIIEGVAQAMRLSLGFNPSPVLACDVSLFVSRYPDGSKPMKRRSASVLSQNPVWEFLPRTQLPYLPASLRDGPPRQYT